jgi:MSHA biogenesis protein MshG
VLSVVVIPKFAPMFKQLGSQLPLPTRIMLASSNLVQHHWLTGLALIALSYAAFWHLTRAGEGRFRWHQLKLRLPVFGPLQLQSVLARAMGTLSLTLSAGLPMRSS